MAVIASICLYLMMFYGVGSIGGQAIFNFPLPGLIEWTEILMCFAIFLALPLAQKDGVQIRITVIRRYLSPQANAVLDIIALVMSLFFFGLLAWRMTITAWKSTVSFEYTDVIIKILIFPGKLAVAFGCILLTLIILFQIGRGLYRLRHGEVD